MVASKSKKGKSQSTHRARSRSAQKSVKKDDKTKKSRSRSSSSRSRSQKRRRRSSSRKRSKSSSRSRSRSRSQRRSRSKSKKRDRKKRKSSHSRKRSRSRRKSRSRSRRGKKEKDKEEAVKVEKKESKQDLTIEEKAAILAKEMAATQLLMAERRERVKLEASKVAMTIKNELAKKAGGFGMNFDGTHACELEINDYPQHARFKGTHRKTFDTVFDLTEATVTTKGTWVPPGRNAMHGERKLYLSIKGTTEASVRSAKQELLRILKEAAMEAKPTKELYSKYAVMFS